MKVALSLLFVFLFSFHSNVFAEEDCGIEPAEAKQTLYIVNLFTTKKIQKETGLDPEAADRLRNYRSKGTTNENTKIFSVDELADVIGCDNVHVIHYWVKMKYPLHNQNGGGSGNPHHSNGWYALSYSPSTGYYGSTHYQFTYRLAHDTARQQCGRNDCITTANTSGCLALSTANHRGWLVATGASAWSAANASILRCEEAFSHMCSTVKVVCAD